MATVYLGYDATVEQISRASDHASGSRSYEDLDDQTSSVSNEGVVLLDGVNGVGKVRDFKILTNTSGRAGVVLLDGVRTLDVQRVCTDLVVGLI